MDLTSKQGIIFDIMRFCVHDGPGIRTTVFLKGCPLRCLWCHNPEGQEPDVEISVRQNRCQKCGSCVSACPAGAVEWQGGEIAYDRAICRRCGTCTATCFAEAREVVGRQVTVAELMREVTKDLAFFEESNGGVTFSGGEPVMQSVFLEASLKFCRRLGLHTAVETSGFAPSPVMERVAEYTDLFLYDIKHMDDSAHRWYTGVSNECILENLKVLAAMRKAIVVRVPLVPGVNDGDDNVHATAGFVASLGSIRDVHLLPLHSIGIDKYGRLGKTYGMPEVEPLGRGRVAAIGRMFESHGLRVSIGG